MKKFTFCLFVIFLTIAVNGQAFGQSSWEEELNHAITGWTKELAAKDPIFMKWTSASYEIETLGPNSKQWLVTLKQDGEKLGYLVIGINHSNQFLLLEYGVGEISLFEHQLLTIYNSEIFTKSTLITLIYRGLESFFLLQTDDRTYAIDAKSGEQIPMEFFQSNQLTKVSHKNIEDTRFINSRSSDGVYLKESYVKPLSFWDEAFPVPPILGKESPLDSMEQLKNGDAYLKTGIWSDQIQLLLPVQGYHQWSDDITYIALEQEGYRFIPLNQREVRELNKTDGISFPSVSLNQLIVAEYRP